jgi:hypothetical protein
MNAQPFFNNITPPCQLAKMGIVLAMLFVASTDFAQNLMMGTIQFPSDLAAIPSIRVYRGGRIIPCESDAYSKKITLTIPREPREETFYLLVTEAIQFHQLESEHDEEEAQNTISFFRVPQKQAYKLYKLNLACERQEQSDNPLQSYKHMFEGDGASHFNPKNGKKKQEKYVWKITEETLSKETRRIPDDTIIVYYYPHLIESIAGGTKFELPTIKMKTDILTLVGSEKNLHDLSNGLLLSCLDHEPLLATMPQKVRFGKLHTLVAPAA